jgi:hypothetical protein
MIQKTVIIVCRNESLEDFNQIARRAHRLDSTVAVIPISEHLHSSLIAKPLLNLPMLVIFLCNPPDKEFHLAGKLAVEEISKIKEYEHFKKNHISCLPIEPFKFGMSLDSSIYGELVVLKPQTIQSTGKDINMIPTNLIPTLKLEDFPEDHLIRRDQYYVQKFVYTGDKPEHYRVLVFLDTVLYIRKNESIFDYPNLNDGLKSSLSRTVGSNYPRHRKHSMANDHEIGQFALKVSATYTKHPIFGVDVVREKNTGTLYALETNPGGNTWHFSSNFTAKMGEDNKLRREQCLKQFNAFDRAAEALIRKAHELAK